jgi:ABC-type nitrate/sulfonate/bicarbonate transport system ATPase subunit
VRDDHDRLAELRLIEHGLDLLFRDRSRLDVASSMRSRVRMHELLREWRVRHEPAALLVAHDVGEAIGLADRVIVLENGRVSSDHRIALQSPRSRTATRAFSHTVKLCWPRSGVNPPPA